MGAAGVAGTRIPFFDTELIDNGLRGVGAHGVCVLALIRARKFVSMISAIRSYWNDGRGPILLGYAVLSYGIAAIEWLLKPGTLIRVFPSLKGNASSARESLWLWTLSLLPLVWLVIVIKGIKKSGRPGIVLVLPVWYGMFWYIMWARLIFSCLFGQECL